MISKANDDVTAKLNKNWRTAIKIRDGFKCKRCGEKKRSKLQVHHIKPRSKYPELIRDINNGITLCVSCHRSMNGNEGAWETLCLTLMTGVNTSAKIIKMMRDLKNAEQEKAASTIPSDTGQAGEG